jgi:hypothetical protein
LEYCSDDCQAESRNARRREQHRPSLAAQHRHFQAASAHMREHGSLRDWDTAEFFRQDAEQHAAATA